MSKLPRLLGSISIRLPDDGVEFNRRLTILDMAHYPILVVGGGEGLRQESNPPADGTGAFTATQAALEEVVKTHRYAATTFASTLAHAQTLIESATSSQPITPATAVALRHLAKTYLHSMLACADEIGTALVGGLAQHSPLAPLVTELRRRIDQRSKVYLLHVQDVLQSQEGSDDEKGTKPVGFDTPQLIR